MATIPDIASPIAVQMGEEYSDVAVKEVFDGFVAEALNEFLSMEDWPFMDSRGAVATTAAVAIYATDTSDNIWNIERVAEAGEEPLIQTTRKVLVDSREDLDEAGTPSHWYPAGVNSSGLPLFGLWPVPSVTATYVILGNSRKHYDGIADVGTTLTLPPDVQNMLRYLVRERFYLNSSDPSSFQKAQSERGQFLRAFPAVRHRHMSVGDRSRIAERNDIRFHGGRFLRMPTNIVS